MSEDWYVDSIEEVHRCAAAVHEALDRTVEALLASRQERLAGTPFVEIVTGLVESGAPSVRRSVDEAFRGYTDAVRAYRAAAIRALVDDEGMTFSDVARLTGVSRQMITRLYRSARARDATVTGSTDGN